MKGRLESRRLSMRSLMAMLHPVLTLSPAAALDNGLARTPPLGLSTWAAFSQHINDSLVRSLADGMVESGLAAAGYTYLMIDDGWELQGCQGGAPGTARSCRNANGTLRVDASKFPSMKATVAYVHERGLKLGLWFGHAMCAGSNDEDISTTPELNFAQLDAALFAEWGVDAIKHDACGSVANTTAAITANYQRYMRLSEAINKTGRPMLYDVVLQVRTDVGNGASLPHTNMGSVWSPEPYGGKEAMHSLGNLWWSLPCNKYDCWECCVSGMTMLNSTKPCTSDPESRAAMRGILPMVDAQDSGLPGFSKGGHWDYSAPGGWNHLDQLAVCLPKTWQGPGLTVVEQHSHFGLWAILASPLLLAFDIRQHASGSACIDMVTNEQVLAISQDSLAIAGKRMKNLMIDPVSGIVRTQLWTRQLSRERVAILLLNRGDTGADIAVRLAETGFRCETATVTDAWTGATRNVTNILVATAVPSHGSFLGILSPSFAHSDNIV